MGGHVAHALFVIVIPPRFEVRGVAFNEPGRDVPRLPDEALEDMRQLVGHGGVHQVIFPPLQGLDRVAAIVERQAGQVWLRVFLPFLEAGLVGHHHHVRPEVQRESEGVLQPLHGLRGAGEQIIGQRFARPEHQHHDLIVLAADPLAGGVDVLRRHIGSLDHIAGAVDGAETKIERHPGRAEQAVEVDERPAFCVPAQRAAGGRPVAHPGKHLDALDLPGAAPRPEYVLHPRRVTRDHLRLLDG